MPNIIELIKLFSQSSSLYSLKNPIVVLISNFETHTTIVIAPSIWVDFKVG